VAARNVAIYSGSAIEAQCADLPNGQSRFYLIGGAGAHRITGYATSALGSTAPRRFRRQNRYRLVWRRRLQLPLRRTALFGRIALHQHQHEAAGRGSRIRRRTTSRSSSGFSSSPSEPTRPRRRLANREAAPCLVYIKKRCHCASLRFSLARPRRPTYRAHERVS